MRWFAAVLLVIGSTAFRSSAADKAPDAPDYEDKLIDGGKLAPLDSGESDLQYNAEGRARSWRVEGFASYLDQGGVKHHENGLVLSGRLDSLEYGAFSADATLRADGTTSVFSGLAARPRLRRGMGRQQRRGHAQHADDRHLAQPVPLLPSTFTTLGAQTEWLRNNGELQLQASVGTPGLFDGLRVPGFSRLGGTIATLGAQLRIDKTITIGAELADANNVPASTDTETAGPKIDSRSAYAAMRIDDGTNWMQLNLLDSQVNEGRHNLAGWFDREVHDERYRWNFGLFHFEPNMVWGYTPITGDLQGGYVRTNYTSQQWTWSLGIDGVAPVSDVGTRGWYSTGNVRYQVDHSTGVGGSLTARTGFVPYSLAGSIFLDETTRFGSSRVQLDLVDARDQLRSQNLTFDQAWPTQVGLRLSTSLSVGQETSPGANIKRVSAAVFGGVDLTDLLSIEGNLRYSVDKDTARTTGVYANLALVWRIAQRWSLVATYYDNHSETAPFTSTLTPLIPLEPLASIPRDRAFFLNVRYEDHAGTPVAPLGGPPGSGAGTLLGYVYYDANDNGRHDANEQGAANLTVVLDGRFATRTDKDGRFEFGLIAAGPHHVAVIPDNLALPYSISGDGRREVMVRTRETTNLDIAATRQQ